MTINSPQAESLIPGQYLVDSLAETEAWGQRLARLLKPNDVVYFNGPMGAGKSSLCRFLIRAIAGDVGEIPSPTFSLIQSYEAESFFIHHLDLYRLDRFEDIVELGLDELRLNALILIEWPDRLGPYGFDQRFEVDMAFTSHEEGRIISLSDIRRQTL